MDIPESGKIERFANVFAFYQFTLGMIRYILNGMHSALQKAGNDELVEMAKTAKKKQQEAVRKENQWERVKNEDPMTSEATVELDARIDKTLSSIVKGAELHTNLEEGAEKRRLAEEFVGDLFPSGVFPFTSKSFPDQAAAVEELVRRMNDEYTEHLDTLGLRNFVDQLEELNAEFSEHLRPADQLEYDEVERAYVEAEDALHELIAHVMSEYADDMETLNEILAPVVEQTERTRRHLQRRGTIPEVDPETGEPVESSDGTSGGQNDGGQSESDGQNDGGQSETDGQNDGGQSNGDTSETDEEPTDGEG